MKSRVNHALTSITYHLCIAVGILAMPLAIVANQLGLSMPLHRLIANVEDAYEDVRMD